MFLAICQPSPRLFQTDSRTETARIAHALLNRNGLPRHLLAPLGRSMPHHARSLETLPPGTCRGSLRRARGTDGRAHPTMRPRGHCVPVQPQAGQKRTADGESHAASALTAAHPLKLPFGTQILVTNLTTGRSVVVADQRSGTGRAQPHHRLYRRRPRRPWTCGKTVSLAHKLNRVPPGRSDDRKARSAQRAKHACCPMPPNPDVFST